MRQVDWAVLAPQLCQLARDAGAHIMDVYAAPDQHVERKADDSPLTLADTASHQCIVAGLARLSPEVALVSEEDAHSWTHRLSMGSFWLIDPLDGTKEFLARNGEFTVNIALVTDGEPVWGVVYAPALDSLYWGGGAFGAYRQSAGHTQPIRVSAPGSLCKVISSKSHLNAETSAFIDRLGDVTLVQAGSSLKFCRIGEGAADVYPRLAPTCEWDTAAAQAVLEGAGGFVYDTFGARLRYGKPEILNPSFIAASVPYGALPQIK